MHYHIYSAQHNHLCFPIVYLTQKTECCVASIIQLCVCCVQYLWHHLVLCNNTKETETHTYVCGMVIEDTVHLSQTPALFGTQGSLILDVSIASYFITNFSIIFIYFILQVMMHYFNNSIMCLLCAIVVASSCFSVIRQKGLKHVMTRVD